MSKAASTETADDTKKYELMLIINPDLGENAAKNRLNEIKKMITSEDGEIFFEDIWGIRDLAYPIKKHRQGYYAVLDFKLDSQKIKEMNSALRIDPELIRHMFTVLPLAYEPKSFAVLEPDEPYVKRERNAPTAKPEARPFVKKEKPPVEAAAPASAAAPAGKAAVAEEEPEAKAPAKEEKQTSLEDVDAKLRSIIDNPDINF